VRTLVAGYTGRDEIAVRILNAVDQPDEGQGRT
jgi:hypothetical protein